MCQIMRYDYLRYIHENSQLAIGHERKDKLRRFDCATWHLISQPVHTISNEETALLLTITTTPAGLEL
jgi:hypothetical protein